MEDDAPPLVGLFAVGKGVNEMELAAKIVSVGITAGAMAVAAVTSYLVLSSTGETRPTRIYRWVGGWMLVSAMAIAGLIIFRFR
jgi:hypothetical protein